MLLYYFFFFNDPATTEIYTLSLHDALPISSSRKSFRCFRCRARCCCRAARCRSTSRSEEHTSELQSRGHLVCRLLLEKKKKKRNTLPTVAARYDSLTVSTVNKLCSVSHARS